ncbi:putative mttA/Hcf106 family protein [Luminiphilus syltensis NOR5-1B]|uniref:Sec-independent protein translocase protein TatA n=1 Tax=Luminiphilus syltensis NOR5-1B TaxID=565045 RepID=B8KUR9_9GAMM|nr:Sec-independent protein translocase subunit TatA [Luminiphilus syltensis]EED35284.1 putative mttA/Hcf106 family protein [Luminiphilus syltensis NOR5-1B]
MGIGGISIWQLLIILAIVVMIFGTSRLKSLGSDLGSAIKGFKNSVNDDKQKSESESESTSDDTATIQNRESDETPKKD